MTNDRTFFQARASVYALKVTGAVCIGWWNSKVRRRTFAQKLRCFEVAELTGAAPID